MSPADAATEPATADDALPRAGAPEPERVRAMFERVTPRYDLLNRLLSGRRDVAWRRRAVRLSGAALPAASPAAPPAGPVLDTATGTGDLALDFLRALERAGGERPDRAVVGADFCAPMLRTARGKAASAGRPLHLAAGDSLRLPFADRTFAAVTSAFAFRNLADPDAGLREMLRILRPGGRVVVLEHRVPGGLIRPFYKAYCRHVLPRIAALISPDAADAYRYLNDSIEAWDSSERLAERLRAAGFADVDWSTMTLGTVAFHTGVRPA